MDTSLRQTTADTLKPSTDTCEVVFVKSTQQLRVRAENDSKLRITEEKLFLDITKYVEKS